VAGAAKPGRKPFALRHVKPGAEEHVAGME